MTHTDSEQNWIDAEFSRLDFGDERLNRRFVLTAKRLASQPESTINQACRSKSELKGAYRLFGNPSVDSDEIQASHQVALAKRMAEHSIVLSVQDTTNLDYSGHKACEGLGSQGRVFTDGDAGLLLHTALALTTNGLPLGILSHNCWARDRPYKKSDTRGERQVKRQKLSPDDKESIKWIQSLEHSIEVAKGTGCRVITIGDREADYSLLMAKAVELNSGFVVRSRVDRVVKSVDGRRCKVYKTLQNSKAKGKFDLEIPSTKGQSKRTAKVEVKFSEFLMEVPKSIQENINILDIKSLPLFVVELKETDTTRKDSLHWILLTSETVNTYEEALNIANWYKARWTIEVYHKTLKSGLKVEDCRLGNADRLFRYLSLAAILGYRILYLSRASRECPDMNCESILSTIEWKALLIRSKKTKNVGTKAPSILEATTMIAQMGGYLARKSDPPPGPIVLWRGMKALSEWVEMYKIIDENG